MHLGYLYPIPQETALIPTKISLIVSEKGKYMTQIGGLKPIDVTDSCVVWQANKL